MMDSENIKIVNTDDIGDFDKADYILDSVREDVAELLEKFGGDSGLYITLYKVDPKSNTSKQVTRFPDVSIPDPHDIGVQHGSGVYWLWINYKTTETKSGRGCKKKRFELAEFYDELKQENDTKKVNDPMYRLKHGYSSGERKESNSSSDMMQMMLSMQQSNQAMIQQMQQASQSNMLGMVTALAPILGTLLQPQKPTESLADKLLPTMLTNMNSNSEKNFEMMTNAFNTGITQGEKMNKDDDKSWMDIAETMIENADKVLNPIFGSLVKKQIQTSPEAQQVLNHKDRYAHLVSGLTKKYGAEKAQEIITKSGVSANQANIPHAKKETKNISPVVETSGVLTL